MHPGCCCPQCWPGSNAVPQDLENMLQLSRLIATWQEPNNTGSAHRLTPAGAKVEAKSP